MKILIINAGSSSLKYELFHAKNANNLTTLYSGIIERIGQIGGVKNHTDAVKIALNKILKEKKIQSLEEINLVGHRVVHGGEKYKKPVRITSAVLTEIKKLCALAPLHNPPNLAAIIACKKVLKNIPHIAVFDTAFHQTLNEKAYLYAIPRELYKKFGIRRYGFHGTSHSYVSKETIKLLGEKNSKIITCHLGNGSSITAILNGKSIDTSMGFTPLEGLPMGTRSGDIDPAAILKIMEEKKYNTQQMNNVLNKNSGLKAISGLSSDVRDLWKASSKNKKAKLALEILAYKTAKYIAGYTASLGGLDALTFTAGIGENAWYIREAICAQIGHLGISLDNNKNKINDKEISDKKSKVKVYVIKTHEEKEIALQSLHALNAT